MIGLLQRVTEGKVVVAGETIGNIGVGLVVLVGVERGDQRLQADRLLERLLSYRVFPDEQGRMNLSVRDVNGGVLLVPQFTLAADTRKGNRPGFSTAAEPAEAKELYEYLVTIAASRYAHVATGRFGADMKVSLTNDGPVTFWIQVTPT
ncbi:MAG: D-aminoacyl-tRNA deacylase [Gammaproteobacteria bacterium]|nr:D-aminoacyl-tRNA deacylase [Gammaproteobacteria bacterium]